MSKEVTVKDLRMGLTYIRVNRVEFRDARLITDEHLAAFDALVEKAEKGELFEKLEKLREQHYYTAIHLKHERVEIRSRDAKYKLAVKSDAPTLAEALKAVPE